MGKEGGKKKRLRSCTVSPGPLFQSRATKKGWDFFFEQRREGWGNSCQRGTTYALAGVFCVPASAQFHRLFFARRRTKNYLSVVVSISLSGFHDNEYGKGENRNRIVRELFPFLSICLAIDIPTLPCE